MGAYDHMAVSVDRGVLVLCVVIRKEPYYLRNLFRRISNIPRQPREAKVTQ